jgi:hypothetical protein
MNGPGSTPPPGSAAPGQTSFYDSAIPPLSAGDYQLIIQQTVQVTPEPPEPPYSFKQRLQIAGPHLQLSPTEVVAKRPAPGASGDFQSWLPHVVLADRTLPWQIAIADPSPGGGSSPAPGTPWLALLLLTGSEIDVNGSPPGPATTGSQTVPLASFLQPPSGTLAPNITTGLGDLQQEQPAPTCTVVDVHFDAFRAVAPMTAELPWLAHVRQVDTSDQEDLDVPAPGWYSVIVGNRLPFGAADNTYIAHLVSLEGFAGYLPDQPPPSTVPALVRLVSLASWSFTSGPDPGDFAQLMKNLNDAKFALPVTVPVTDPAGQLVSGAVQSGYAPLRYATRLGEETTGWYRGPLQPIELANNPQPPYPVASSALIFDPSSGMFDASYAAAWELGRLLTLANGPVTASLTQWAGGAVSTLQLLLERTRAAGAGLLAAPALATGAVSQAARRLIAERVLPTLLGRDGAPQALGVPGDPTGLRGHSFPGLLDAASLEEVCQSGGDVFQRLADRALGQAGQGSTTSAATGEKPPAQAESRPEDGEH